MSWEGWGFPEGSGLNPGPVRGCRVLSLMVIFQWRGRTMLGVLRHLLSAWIWSLRPDDPVRVPKHSHRSPKKQPSVKLANSAKLISESFRNSPGGKATQTSLPKTWEVSSGYRSVCLDLPVHCLLITALW